MGQVINFVSLYGLIGSDRDMPCVISIKSKYENLVPPSPPTNRPVLNAAEYSRVDPVSYYLIVGKSIIHIIITHPPPPTKSRSDRYFLSLTTQAATAESKSVEFGTISRISTNLGHWHSRKQKKPDIIFHRMRASMTSHNPIKYLNQHFSLVMHSMYSTSLAPLFSSCY